MRLDFSGLDSPFGKWPTTGGLARRPPAPPPEHEPEIESLQPLSQPVKEAPKVNLINLKWSEPEGEFNESIAISADADLPEPCKHLTRVEFQVWALTPDGKRESIDKKDGYLSEGRAEATVTLFWPGYRKDGSPPEKCEMVFVAKHRESKPAESGAINVSGPIVPIGKIWIKLISPKGFPLSGIKCELKGIGKRHSGMESDAKGEVLWEKVHLGEWSLETKAGTSSHSVPVPWLTEDSVVHILKVKDVGQVLGPKSSNAGLASRASALGYANVGAFKSAHAFDEGPDSDSVAGEFSAFQVGG